MGSAQLDILSFEERSATETSPIPYAQNQAQAVESGLKQQVAERLAAHRERRNVANRAESATAERVDQPRRTRQNPLAEAVAQSVAAHYEQSPSYRAFLAEQAQRAIEESAREAEAAAAEAQIAARNAAAIAAAQQQLLAELELWNAAQEFTPATAELANAVPAIRRRAALPKAAAAVKEVSTAGLTVRLYEDLGTSPRNQPAVAEATLLSDFDHQESLALDEEIAFRQAPIFEPFSIDPPTPLPANLLEFPRQLVAARKARPRIAEGPLREEVAPRSPQLRIFEVEPEQISTEPAPASVTPEWASIHLGEQTKSQAPAPEAAARTAPLPAYPVAVQTAPLQLRLMATCVDVLLVCAAFLAFTGVAVHIAQRIPNGIPAAIAAAGTLAIFWPLYQLLCFTFSDQTPGMRYARLGFCTLSDENPARSAIRRRIPAQLIAVIPFGLGILWALLDDEGLGWHDRISRMYQRAY